MPNPTITPWAGGTTTYTVTGSTFAAVDIRPSDLDNSPVSLLLTAPAGATVHAVRDPAGWAVAETALLTGGAWVGGPLLLGGQWNLVITPGGAVTDPATVTIDDPDGSNPTGTLRLIFRNLAGAAATIEKNGGTQSIDRVLAHPSILNAQVTTPLPVEELDNVTLDATAQATQSVNPAPAPALSALPAIVAEWNPEAANLAAVSNFASIGTHASFKAPGAYGSLILDFRLRAAYDLDGAGLASASNPVNQQILPVTVEIVTHGMVLVLDRSGSMGRNFGPGVSRWQAAVRAGHAWLDLFRAFRPGNPHMAGIVTFQHNTCQFVLSDPAQVTLRDPATGNPAMAGMSPISGFGDLAQLQLGNVSTCTPIGDALVTAWNAIGTALLGGSGGKKASVLLLTDGYENSGEITIVNANDPNKTFAVKRTTLTFPESLIGNRLFTLAVGQQVDQARLNLLGTGFYHMSNDATQMLPAFTQMIGDVLEAQAAMPLVGVVDPGNPPNALYFPASAGEQRIALLVPWTSATDNLSVAWRTQGSPGAFTAISPLDAGVQYYRRDRHGLMVAHIPTVTGATAATEWRVQHTSGGMPQPLTNQQVSCIIDLAVKADVGFDKPQYFIGEPIKLSCRINHGGSRVTGASVGIDVARPGEGLGTFLATNAGRYKVVQKDSSSTQSPDPPKGKGHMHATLLDVLGMDDLPVVTPPAFKLHDDGAHGDGAANDGDYANVFTDTVKEGTYTFRFRIEGTLPDGSRYSRLFVRSTWVGVKPDPGHLGGVWTTLSNLPQGVTGSLLTFTPKTKSGEYLGPFQTDVIAISVADGTLDGELIDNLDGSYSQRVIHKDGRQPVVSIDIQGVRMDPTGPGIGGPDGYGEGGKCSRLWHAALRCTLRAIGRMLGLHK